MSIRKSPRLPWADETVVVKQNLIKWLQLNFSPLFQAIPLPLTMTSSATPSSRRVSEIRAVIHGFIAERLDAKLEKLSEDDPKREVLIAKYEPDAWLADAARRIDQIQAVTHALKATHPDARGTSLYALPSQLPCCATAVGSYTLGAEFTSDVVGNAAALDVYKFLKLEIDGRSLLDSLLAEDEDALNALSDDIAKARGLRDAFVSLTQPRESLPASHTLAKQIYWLEGDVPTNDSEYHLLAPLYATSFAQKVYAVIQEDRFGEEAKRARDARRENKPHEGVVHDYPHLAVQKMGGTKPQNISQLTSERRGYNYLLSCAAPIWKTPDLPSLHKVSSFFDVTYGGRPDVRKTLSDFLRFLKTDPAPNKDTRNRRDAYTDMLIDELVQLAARYQQGWEPGWSRAPEIDLPWEERLWLDPYRSLLPEEEQFRKDWVWLDWPNQIGDRFGRWLNSKLEQYLPAGDVEFRHWKKELLLDESQGGWAQQLHRQLKKLEVPTCMPNRES